VSGMLQLRPMTQAEFDEWLPVSQRTYAEEEIRAGRTSPEAARERVERLFADLLPDGLATEGHLLCQGIVDGEVVGFIWIGLPDEQRPQAWIYDIEVDAAHRRRGHGRALMLAAEAELRARGVTRLGLNVFGPNTGARRLYETLGFEITSAQMSKELT
jgi:ribosomal protein S18 acetylase RimI-like enzyme